MTIHVLGSLNMDLVCQTPRLPLPGETILGQAFTQAPGGKGANQAVAAARLGGITRMVGRVGEDSFAEDLLRSLMAVDIDTTDVVQDAEASTGIAAIAVDAQGQNQIIVIPGTNGRVNEEDVQRLTKLLAPGDTLLLQLEIPVPAVLAAAQAASQRQVNVMLDPAPAPETLPSELLQAVNILTPNQREAAQLVGFAVNGLETAAAAAQELRARGVETVMVKLGEQGVWVESAADSFHQPAFSTTVVDTVAAGDAFNGGLAVALSEAMSLPEAVKFASATAALSVSKAGAQSAMPSRSEVEQLLNG